MEPIKMGGQAKGNGIILMSDRYCVDVTVVDGEILVESEALPEISEKFSKLPKILRTLYSIFYNVVKSLTSIKGVVTLAVVCALYYLLTMFFGELQTLIVVFSVIFLVCLIGKRTFLKETFKYHGAEHIVIAASKVYDKLIVKDLLENDTYNVNCGSCLTTIMFLSTLVFHSINLITGLEIFRASWVFLFSVILFEIVRSYEFPGRVARPILRSITKAFFLNDPDEKHLSAGVIGVMALRSLQKSKKGGTK